MRIGTTLLFILLLTACASHKSGQENVGATERVVHANENRVAAGTYQDGVLTLRLEIGEGAWRPERSLPAYDVLGFGETGKTLTTPGPLIRVRDGTLVDISINNPLSSDIFVHGLDDRANSSLPLRVPAHGTAGVRFRATRPGTYYYWGTTGTGLNQREGLDSQLTGALIVDPAGEIPRDRVFVIGRLGSASDGVNVGSGLGAWVINGQSWPDTERLTYQVGEAVAWRWINATDHRHPMHLHGTYFQVTSAGDNWIDVPRVPGERNLVVTQPMQPGSTMSMIWSPAEPGNWLFHCHNLFHVMPDNRLQVPNWYEEYAALPHDQHMAGLVLGIHAFRKTERVAQAKAVPRRLKLRIGERAGVRYQTLGLSAPGLGYALASEPITSPGPMIVLEQKHPVEITIVNDIARATAVHWHGIELESYFDGVPHWSGDSRNVTPHIAPGSSFVARFTPPRAGTFIYHTHFNDYVQLTTGLYGALIVLEPGQVLDNEVDHVFVFGQGGLDDQKDPVLVNGATNPPPMSLQAGRNQRFRLIGITASLSVRVRLTRAEELVMWRFVAKDGAALPEALVTTQPADLEIFPGETYDFEFLPIGRSPLRLEVELQRATGQRATVALSIDR
ncbi:MAG TPA: multicopper oxidase domain-containing protein [Steroidobacteraceae bacterium]|nr:multicopper oxidase domain-containing protein [Steroidobacteraceae bacterium]